MLTVLSGFHGFLPRRTRCRLARSLGRLRLGRTNPGIANRLQRQLPHRDRSGRFRGTGCRWSGKSPAGSWGVYSRRLSEGEFSATTSLASEGPNLYLQAAADSQGDVHKSGRASATASLRFCTHCGTAPSGPPRRQSLTRARTVGRPPSPPTLREAYGPAGMATTPATSTSTCGTATPAGRGSRNAK